MPARRPTPISSTPARACGFISRAEGTCGWTRAEAWERPLGRSRWDSASAFREASRALGVFRQSLDRNRELAERLLERGLLVGRRLAAADHQGARHVEGSRRELLGPR